jgi:hypothetical protein
MLSNFTIFLCLVMYRVFILFGDASGVKIEVLVLVGAFGII